MTFRKRLVLILLGILLFLSLTAFGPVLAFRQTVFNTDYFASKVDEIDISSLAHDWLSENIAEDRPYLAKAIEIAVINLEPWIKEQLRPVVKNMHAFLLESLEKDQLLDMIISQRPLIEEVAGNLESVLQLPIFDPVFDSLGITPESIQQYISVSQVTAYLDALEKLAQFRQAVIYAQNSYAPLIALILLLITGIIFINRNIRGITRQLGIIFATYGFFQYFGIPPAKTYGSSAILQYDIPPLLQDWIQRLINDFATVLEVFSIALFIFGIVLIIVSFTYKPRQSSETRAIEPV